MAKTPRGKKVEKPGEVIRLKKKDVDKILKALGVLPPRKGEPVAPVALAKDAMGASPAVFKQIREVLQACLCQSCPPGGKVVVIDIDD